jgi:hypothetical protein
LNGYAVAGDKLRHSLKEGLSMPRKMTQEEFIAKARKVHGDRYDYSKVDYRRSKEKVKIICPKHGSFMQRPNDHLRGKGCPRCWAERQAAALSMSRDEFIAKAREVHGDRYDYSKVDYRGSQEKVSIVCPKHGEFMQRPNDHLEGYGCPKCGVARRAAAHVLSCDEFIAKSREVHGDRYDYSKVDYRRSKEKVSIVCPKHGEFMQTPNSHLLGQGCSKCGVEQQAAALSMSRDEFIAKAREVHGDKYDYSKTTYTRSHDKVIIVCKTHGGFMQRPNTHLNGHGCPKCGKVGPSKTEDKIAAFIEGLGFEVQRNRRDLLGNGKELDIYVPERKVAIEYNGLRFHQWPQQPNKRYHQEKTLAARENGIRLIHIFEDQWASRRPIFESIMRFALGKPVFKHYGRKTEVVELTPKEAAEFLKENHFYRTRGAKHKIGLRHKKTGELLAVMTFGFSRFNKNYDIELVRYAPKLNTAVVGGPQKLFNYFVETRPEIQTILCYADASVFDGALYEQLGFDNEGITEANPWYLFDDYERRHRMSFTKAKMGWEGMEGSARELTISELGATCIFDCGSWKLVWSRQ